VFLSSIDESVRPECYALLFYYTTLFKGGTSCFKKVFQTKLVISSYFSSWKRSDLHMIRPLIQHIIKIHVPALIIALGCTLILVTLWTLDLTLHL